MKDKLRFSDILVGFLRFVLGFLAFTAGEAWLDTVNVTRSGPFWGNFTLNFIRFATWNSIFIIVLLACLMLWYIYYGHNLAEQAEKETEQEEQKKVIEWKCEYCGDSWPRSKAKGKPYPYQIGRCSRAPGGEHVLFEVDRNVLTDADELDL